MERFTYRLIQVTMLATIILFIFAGMLLLGSIEGDNLTELLISVITFICSGLSFGIYKATETYRYANGYEE